jgi:hypothetical protein
MTDPLTAAKEALAGIALQVIGGSLIVAAVAALIDLL